MLHTLLTLLGIALLTYFLIRKVKPFLTFILKIFHMMFKLRKRATANAKFLYADITENLGSEEERFALGISNLEHERITALVKEDLELFKFLKKEWGRSFKTDKKGKRNVRYLLMQTWSEGSVNLSIYHQGSGVTVKDLVAFDCARFAELVRIALFLKLFNEEEAWGFLFLNAQRVQDSFEDWDDFKRSYFRGWSLHDFDTNQDDKFHPLSLPDEKSMTSKVEVRWPKEEIFSDFKPVQDSI